MRWEQESDAIGIDIRKCAEGMESCGIFYNNLHAIGRKNLSRNPVMKQKNRKNILILGATGFGNERGWNFAKALKLQGHNVCYVTNFSIYGERAKRYGWKPVVVENIEGIKTLRVPILRFLSKGKGVFSKLLLRFFFSVSLMLSLPFVGLVDIAYSRGPHPFSDFYAILIKKIKGALLFLDVTDAERESLSMVKVNKPFLFLLGNVGKIANVVQYALSDGIITLNESIKKIISRYTRKEIRVVFNAIDLQNFHPMSKQEAYNTLSRIPQFATVANKFVVLYTGNIGMLQTLGAVINAAEKLNGFEDVMFLLVGEGEAKDNLMKEVVKRGLTNVSFVDFQPPERMPLIINLSDICLLPLMDSSIHHIAMPKKFFEYAACGKPILCFSPASEASNLIAKREAGIIVAPDDLNGFVVAVRNLRNERKKLESMGRNARSMAEELFSLTHAGEALNTYFEMAMEERVNKKRRFK